MEKDQKVKLLIGVVVLVLAGLLLAWNFGLFESAPTRPTQPPPNAAPQPPPQPPPGSPTGSQPPPVG